MATKQELVDGIRFLVRETARVASHFSDDQWNAKTVDGWTVKEVYAHILSTGRNMTLFLPMVRDLPAGVDLDSVINVDDVNAQGVAANIEQAPAQIVAGIAEAYEALVPVIEGLDEQLMAKEILFSPYRLPVSELAATAIVLHGLAHTYHCAAAGTPHI